MRRRSRTDRSLTAAAVQITDPAKTFRSSVSTSSDRDDWQLQAWEYLERVGELRYYTSWRANSVSRCRIVGSDFDPITGKPTGSTIDPRVDAIVRDIAGGISGQAQLLRRLTIFLTVPGEGYVAMILRDREKETNADGSPLPEPTPEEIASGIAPAEEWLTLSRDEIATKGAGELILTLPDGIKHTFDPLTDILFRVWNPHPRKAQDADSPVRSCRDVLSEIVRTTMTIDNAAKSRLVGNGILFVPQEMSLPRQNGPTAAPLGIDPDPNGPVQWEKATSQDLQDLLYKVATTAYADQDSMAAFLPIVASVPGEWTKNVTHIKLDSDVSKNALETRDKAIHRLAMSLDVAPERLLGMGENSNHWSAWAIDDSDVKIHIAPALETICDALNQFVFKAALTAIGIDPDMHCIWYTTNELTQDPDKKDEAKTLAEAGAITNASYRDALGFDETDAYDLTTFDGWQQLARDRAAKDVTLIPLLAPLLGASLPSAVTAAPPAPAELPAAPETEPPPSAEPPEPTAPPEDESLPASALPIARMCLARTLELANKRRRNRKNSAAFRGKQLHEAHLNLPRLETDPFELIDGWDSIVDPAEIRAAGLDPARFMELIEERAGQGLAASCAVSICLDDLVRVTL